MKKLSEVEVKRSLRSVPHWQLKRGAVRRVFEFVGFAEAMKFVNAVARAAEKADHHPDIDIRWNKVTLALVTHSAGGLTTHDFALAEVIDRKVEKAPTKAKGKRRK